MIFFQLLVTILILHINPVYSIESEETIHTKSNKKKFKTPSDYYLKRREYIKPVSKKRLNKKEQSNATKKDNNNSYGSFNRENDLRYIIERQQILLDQKEWLLKEQEIYIKRLKIQDKAKEIQKIYSKMDPAEFNQYKETLNLLGFDLTSFQNLLSVIQGEKHISLDELQKQMIDMQKNLKTDLQTIPFSKESFYFLKKNEKIILEHIIKLNELLKEISSTFYLSEEQKNITHSSRTILERAIDSIKKIKNIPLENLIEEESQYAFIASVANTALASLPILLDLWNNREMYREKFNLLKKGDITESIKFINDTFNITDMTLEYLKNKALSYIANASKKTYKLNIPEFLA